MTSSYEALMKTIPHERSPEDRVKRCKNCQHLKWNHNEFGKCMERVGGPSSPVLCYCKGFEEAD
jgi:hypothetical protein